MDAKQVAFEVLTEIGKVKYAYSETIVQAVAYVCHKRNVTDETIQSDAVKLVQNSLKLLNNGEIPYHTGKL